MFIEYTGDKSPQLELEVGKCSKSCQLNAKAMLNLHIDSFQKGLNKFNFPMVHNFSLFPYQASYFLSILIVQHADCRIMILALPASFYAVKKNYV